MSTSSIRAEHVPADPSRHRLAVAMPLVGTALAAVSAGLGFLLARYAGAAPAPAVVIAVVYFACAAAVVVVARRVAR